MRLFLLPSSFDGTAPLVLTGRDYNYIVRVLRLKQGDALTGRDIHGRPWNLSITQIGPSSCTLTGTPADNAVETTDALPSLRPESAIVLYQCQPKGRKMEDIIRMATEAGVLRIVPVRSRNCVSDISAKEESKLARYQAVVREAVQQSGSLVPTVVERSVDIAEVPSHFASLCRSLGQEGRGLFFHQAQLEKDQKNLMQILSGFEGCIGVLIGSEGGLAPEETDNLQREMFLPVLLKTNILRCETAAIYAVSAVQTIIEK